MERERERHTHTHTHKERQRYITVYACVHYITLWMRVCAYITVSVCVCMCTTWVCVTVQDVSEPSVQLKLQVKNPDSGEVKPVAFTISANKFRVLLNGKPVYFHFQPRCVHLCGCVFVCVHVCTCASVCICLSVCVIFDMSVCWCACVRER